jgi:hypothetical protein
LLTEVKDVTIPLAEEIKSTPHPLKSVAEIKTPIAVKPFLPQKVIHPDLNTANRQALQLYVQHLQLKAYSASTFLKAFCI